MKGIILYSSRYGATRRYAEWLAEETGFDCVEAKKARIGDVTQCDTIVFGGGIYASGIDGLSFLKKHIGLLRDKKVIVFCDGASPYDEAAFRQIVDHNLKGPLAGLPCFYCRGAWDPDNMRFADKVLCRMLHGAVAKKKPEDRAVWEKALMEAGSVKHDLTDRAGIAPILAAMGQTPRPERSGV